MFDVIGVLFSGIIYIALGIVWYSPFLFGNIWAKARGIHMDQMEKMQIPKHAIIKALGNAFFLAISLKVAFLVLGFISLSQHLILALVGGTFVIGNELTKYIWEDQPWILVFINGVYFVLSLLLMSAIMFYL